MTRLSHLDGLCYIDSVADEIARAIAGFEGGVYDPDDIDLCDGRGEGESAAMYALGHEVAVALAEAGRLAKTRAELAVYLDECKEIGA